MAWRLGIETANTRSMKHPRKHRPGSRKKAALLFSPGRMTTVVVIGALAVVLLIGLLLLWQKLTTTSSTTDYEGRVVDRWADYSGPEQGAQPRFRLLVESLDHKRFTIKVDDNVYESARVGMRIKSRAGQIVLIDSGKTSPDDR